MRFQTIYVHIVEFILGSLQILVSQIFVFGSLGCMIFFTMVSVCKPRQTRLFKNANKRLRTFVDQDLQKTKERGNGMKSSIITKVDWLDYLGQVSSNIHQLHILVVECHLFRNQFCHYLTQNICLVPMRCQCRKLQKMQKLAKFLPFQIQ